MSACVRIRHNHTAHTSPPSRASGIKRPHSPPPPRRGGRFRIAGADLSASITVFLIAVPMSLGLAVAMDAPLEAGLISAAVGGIVAGLLGGTPLQVSGPSAGLTVVTAELIQIYGWRTTCAITIGAGLLQILLGSLRAARGALAVSPAIVHGTLAGIGVAIALAQLHIVLGASPQSSAAANALALPEQLGRTSPAAPLIGALTIAVLVVWPRLPGRIGRAVRRLPAALASVAIATAVAAVAAPGITRVDLPSWRSHALPELPQGPVLALATAVLTVLLVASLESLLAAVAVDKLTADRAGGRTADSSPPAPDAPAAPRVQRSDLDRELRGQGIANVLAGLLGGLPVSGGAVRSSANVRAGATGRAATVLHGVWVLLAAGLLVTALEWIPLAALAALVMVVGFQMVNYAHIRNVHKHREFLVYGATITGVVLFGVLEGVAIGIAVAVAVALHRLARTRITVTDQGGQHLVVVRGQLTFLAVPRLSRALGQLPRGGDAVVELDGFFMDHAAYETIQDWSDAQTAQGGHVVFTGRSGGRIAEPASAAHSCCRPWTPWRNHHCHDRPDRSGQPVDARRAAATGAAFALEENPRADQGPAGSAGAEADARAVDAADAADAAAGSTGRSDTPGDGAAVPRRTGAHRLASGLSSFQRNTAPLVRDELARLAREGQRPSQLFITCADSRLVTSMITASGPGDLFTVRNVGNLVPPPGAEAGDDSVGAAIEYAVDVLKVESITVCGHSGCGAMQALMGTRPDTPRTSLWRWLRHGLPSLERMTSRHHAWARISGRLPADEVEQLCLTNVVQQLDHLRAHESVARRLAEGALQLHGMYFHVGEAQAYLLAEGASAGSGVDEVFDRVGPCDPNHSHPYDITDLSDPTSLTALGDPGDHAAVSVPTGAAGPADPTGSGELERTSA
ncbi:MULTISPECIES: bifunctional SulP family inorganic anion transporter/carbonic anhydrase [unclassified Streptomyces]|uniref:bifunctional SulP family inorganic anion transporter/carbonic anhydrase n=1 Tax=unclassified Streptomyces TaxID=2593676 RepID=UPI0029BA3693|nr:MULTISPECIES: bifunctional SulP family inorganic anion transporter/carbonic anhydrase [unclassified Streptomyces]MDX3770251.1 bifunctional SulP family inorganic anion transporter/carbonic anhydrase [Streptomyces sp. AK08-01B]MDX3819522.1 bifunctional SulP family inorganic anion transporter/carbonic anhydrase [Streptomyces sp. AK08-01A]